METYPQESWNYACQESILTTMWMGWFERNEIGIYPKLSQQILCLNPRISSKNAQSPTVSRMIKTENRPSNFVVENCSKFRHRIYDFGIPTPWARVPGHMQRGRSGPTIGTAVGRLSHQKTGNEVPADPGDSRKIQENYLVGSTFLWRCGDCHPKSCDVKAPAIWW